MRGLAFVRNLLGKLPRPQGGGRGSAAPKRAGKAKGQGGINPLLLLGLAGALAFRIYQGMVVPLSLEVEEMRTEAQAFDRNALQVAQAKEERLRQQVGEVRRRLAEALPESVASADRLKGALYATAKRVGVEAFSLSDVVEHPPAPPEPGRVEVSFRGKGSWSVVYAFFREVEAMGGRLDFLTAKPAGGRTVEASGRLVFFGQKSQEVGRR